MNIRESFTKREWLGIGMLLSLCVLSFESWRLFQRAMSDNTLSLWYSFPSFFLLSSLFLLGSVVWKRKTLRFLGSFLLFFPGIFYFSHSWEYLIACVLSFPLFVLGVSTTMREEEDRLRFHFFKNVRAGSFFFVLGFSLLISTSYYVSLQNVSWEEMVPRFRIGDGVTKILFKTVGVINPSFGQLSEEDMTVDDFLRTLDTHTEEDQHADVQNSTSRDMTFLSSEIDQFLKQKNLSFVSDTGQIKTEETLFLEGGRKQIASLAGRTVSGDEKISDVLSFTVQSKLIALINGRETLRHMPSQAIPFFLSLLLFLTLLSLSSVIVPICILFSWLLFFLCCKFNLLTLATAPVEQEYLMR